MTALDITGILAAAQGHALASGLFERVNGHEPKNVPGQGITASMWVESIAPAPLHSGLSVTSGRIEISIRITTSMTQGPQDGIDPKITGAVDALLRAYSGDFTLGELVAVVDLLGHHGTALSARAGYIKQDEALLRAVTITLPLIVNDLWNQGT